MNKALKGANKLYAHLKTSGTGKPKLDIVEAAILAGLATGDSERAGANAVIAQMGEKFGQEHGTVTKAKEFAKTLSLSNDEGSPDFEALPASIQEELRQVVKDNQDLRKENEQLRRANTEGAEQLRNVTSQNNDLHKEIEKLKTPPAQQQTTTAAAATGKTDQPPAEGAAAAAAKSKPNK